MAPKPNIKKRAAIIKAKLANPDASSRDIERQVGADHSVVCRTLQDAREKGLLMTDRQTIDFFTKGAIEEAAHGHAQSIAIHREDLETWKGRHKLAKKLGPDYDPLELETAESKRRSIARELAEATSKALHARSVVVGTVNQLNSAAPSFVMPVIINFTRSSAKALPPLRRDAVEATVLPQAEERAS